MLVSKIEATILTKSKTALDILSIIDHINDPLEEDMDKEDRGMCVCVCACVVFASDRTRAPIGAQLMLAA